MIFSIALLFLNFHTGFSATQPIESYIYAFININMGTLAAGFYVVFEVELSFEKYGKRLKDELKMPFTLMDYYDYTRNRASKFIY